MNKRTATPVGDGNAAGRIHDQMLAIWYALWVAHGHLRLYHGPDFSINVLLEGVLELFGSEGKAPPLEANDAVRRVLGMPAPAVKAADPAVGKPALNDGSRPEPDTRTIIFRGKARSIHLDGDKHAETGVDYNFINEGELGGNEPGPLVKVDWRDKTIIVTLEPNIGLNVRQAKTGKTAVYQDGATFYEVESGQLIAKFPPIADHDTAGAKAARERFLSIYEAHVYFPDEVGGLASHELLKRMERVLPFEFETIEDRRNSRNAFGKWMDDQKPFAALALDDILAEAFRCVVMDHLTEDELITIDERNQRNPRSECASHDFLDANQAMLDAATFLLGFEPILSNQWVRTWMDSSWNIAKRTGFASAYSDIESGIISTLTKGQTK